MRWRPARLPNKDVRGVTKSPLGKCPVEQEGFLKEGDNLSPPFALPYVAAEDPPKRLFHAWALGRNL